MESPTSRDARRRPGRAAAAFLLLALLAAIPAVTGAFPATVRSDGLLEVDGEPFFPVGLVDIGYWHYPDDWNDRIRESGANVVWDIEAAYADTVPMCLDLLDSALVTGYKLILGSGDTWNWDSLGTPELEVDQLLYEVEEIPALLQCIAAVPEPVIGFVNRDEPSWTISRNQIGDIDQAHILWTYGQLHQDLGAGFVAMNFAPVHLSGDIAQWKADITPFLDATDVVMHASYPYPAGPGTCFSYNVFDYPECRMDRLAMAADVFLGELNHPGQPLWMIVQAYKAIPLRELRWEAHAAIVHGATGVLWAGWPWWLGPDSGEANWPVTVQVMNETVALHRFLVGRDVPVVTDRPDVEARAKRAGVETAVFVISRFGYSGPVTLDLSGMVPGRREVEVWGESRTLVADGGRLTDTIQPYESHVYIYRGRFEGRWPADSSSAARLSVSVEPNPTRGPSVVRFEAARDATVLVRVHDAAGRRVATLGRRSPEDGRGQVSWDGRDDRGRAVAAGVYFVRAESSDGRTATARVLVRR